MYAIRPPKRKKNQSKDKKKKKKKNSSQPQPLTKKPKITQKKNPIGFLQELSVKLPQATLGMSSPTYQTITESSTVPLFVILASVKLHELDQKVEAYGEASCKKVAKANAARNLLLKLAEEDIVSCELIYSEVEFPSEEVEDSSHPVITELANLCSQRALPMPTYTEHYTNEATDKPFTATCRVRHWFTEAKSTSSKREARNISACLMLDAITSSPTNQLGTPPPECTSKSTVDNFNLPLFCQSNGLPNAVYNVESETGPAHAPTFQMSCTVGEISRKVKAKSKKEARKKLSVIMIKALQEQMKKDNEKA